MTADLGSMSAGPPMTWVDIARALSALDPSSDAWRARPTGLNRIRVDWAGALFEVELGCSREDVKEWLKGVVPGLLLTDDREAFQLDGPTGLDRLPIEFDESTGPECETVSLGTIDGVVTFGSVKANASNGHPVPIIACHSVKGGTGRTTSAIAIASIWQKRSDKPILVVDADIEAPGLSYLFAETRTETRVSFEDLIALAHAFPSKDKSVIIQWVAKRLQSQRLGQLLILPVRRALNELASSSIRTEHIATRDNPRALAALIARTAEAAGCGGAVVDLRAGLVPVATQLMLDPDVFRVICTSLTNQSVKATGALVTFIARELRKFCIDQTPLLLIVNRIPTVFQELGIDDKILNSLLDEVETSLVPDDTVDIGQNATVLDKEIELQPYIIAKISDIPDLQVPRARWDDFAAQLEMSGFGKQIRPSVEEWLGRVLPQASIQNGSVAIDAVSQATASETPQEKRKKLNEFAKTMEFAEARGLADETPLLTGALRAFCGEAQPPIAISEGAKGTGKTLTARYFIRKGTWKNAVSHLIDNVVPFDAEFLPVVSSIVGANDLIPEVEKRRNEASTALNFGPPLSITDTISKLKTEVEIRRTQPEWTSMWLDVIAWSIGFENSQHGAGERLLSRLRETRRPIVAIIEGIEEIGPTVNEDSFTAMLGALLVDLPARLRIEQGRPLGLIVFARRDTVEIGVPQNVAQFRKQYRDFALTWEEPDVLELAAWLSTKSGALEIWNEKFRQLTRDEQEKKLEALWGRKLGPDKRDGKRTQEAYTANWVLAVLSDLQGRLTARDFVRFIKEASGTAVTQPDETQYAGRLLPPSVLRKAVGPTSAAKVEETEEEIPELKAVFSKIKQNKSAVKAPISQDDIQQIGISREELILLHKHGVILDDSPPYEVPELFRIGLGLTHGGARRNVIGIMRRAKVRTSLRTGR